MEERAAALGIEREFRMAAIHRVLFPPTGTIHCSALNEKGEISGCTTTSGLAFKLPGRCGDSPIIGAGCYTDQDVGSAGATGSGEENIKVAGAHTIVENMRRGMSPQEAGMDALKRIVRNYNNDMNKPARGHDLLHPAKTVFMAVSRCGKAIRRLRRTKSRSTMGQGDLKRRRRC
jgi:N4-(beta-N-acetylglucosaminyl)-L-asparaginase